MLIEVKVPQLSESVSAANLVCWHGKEGDAVVRDENLVDIETDKVVLETPAPADGVLVKILSPNGASVSSGEVIAQIDTDAQSRVLPPKPALAAHSAAPGPAARKILAEKGIAAAEVRGSGPGGRITKADALSSAATLAPGGEGELADRPEQRVKISRLRARIAERLLQAQANCAILTTFNEVNMAPVIELRKRYQERFEKEYGVRLGFMSFFVKAVVAALEKYPILNAFIDGDEIVYHGYFDIGIAVGSPRGLVVPILRDASAMSVAKIEKAIVDFGTRAREGKLTIEELTGGTFSISNGGVFGSMLSTPIINPPQSAILGIHATRDRPVVENGQVVIRPINYLALSYDHRIIDGREAVLGLVAIKEALEDPARLLLGI